MKRINERLKWREIIFGTICVALLFLAGFDTWRRDYGRANNELLWALFVQLNYYAGAIEE